MGRIIGLIGGTCLLIAVVRLTNLQHDDHTLKADVVRAGTQHQLSSQDAYRRGKEMYLRGRYEEAISLLESATGSTTGLDAASRRQAEEYLARTRMKLAQLATGEVLPRAQSPDAAAFDFAADQEPAMDVMRTRVERLMSQSVAAAKAGYPAEAQKLAQQAFQLAKNAELKFAAGEITPAELLKQLQSGRPVAAGIAARKPAGGEMPEWAFETNTVKTAAAENPMADFALMNAEAPQKAPANEVAPVDRKTQARLLVDAARVDLKAGNIAEARRKALQADELDVTYDLFDDRPELVLAEVDRRAGTQTVVADNTPKQPKVDSAAMPTAPSNGGSQTVAVSELKQPVAGKAEAARLLAAARQDLQNGNLEGAQQKAQQVQQMDVAYKLFEDRPELVMNDVAAAMAASNIAKNTQTPKGVDFDFATGQAVDSPVATASAPAANENQMAAKDLLSQARKALADGRVTEARALAIEAEKQKATYGLFDDRPEIVLADIARAVSREKSGDMSADIVAGNLQAPATAPAQNANTPKAQAMGLMQEARQLMAAGQLEAAEAKVQAADQLDVAYGVFDDRPELILAEIRQSKSANVAKSMPLETPAESTVKTADASFGDEPRQAMTFTAGAVPGKKSEPATLEFEETPIVALPGVPATDHYQRGLAELRGGNRAAAYQAFLAAHRSGQQLDPARSQRLQDYMRELAPRNNNAIQLTSQENTPDALTVPGAAAPYEEPSPLDAAAQAESVKFDRLRTDSLNAIFRAERLRETDPEQALQIIDRAMASVEGAELGPDATGALLRSLQKTHASLQSTIMQQKPNLDQKKKNDETLALLERDRNNKIRVEQEFATLVEEFNSLYQQKRFAEAEVVAKKAKELDPKNPVSETLFWKSRFARRNENNNNLKLAKEESFIQQLDDVEWAAVVDVNDKDPISYGSGWADISKRRKGKYGADNRVRSEDELRIQESLNRRISLHEENVPLNEVMQKIAALAGFNYQFDKLGLEEEGVTPSVPVTINVDGITVRSVLNLMLEQYRLGYMVQDEVLKITSRMRQQGDLVVATYPVADLVIPISNFVGQGNAANNGLTDSLFNPGGNSQFSTPPMGMGGGQPFAQVGTNPINGMNMLGGASPAGNGNRLSGPANRADFQTLVDLIATTVAPDSWAEVGGNASIRQYESTLSLVVRQTQKVHEEIADLLDQLRRLQDLQVTIEVRFVTVADRFFERIGIDFDFNVQSTVGGPDVDNNGIPLLPFGSVLVPQAGANGTTATAGTTGATQGQQGQQAQQGSGGFFTVPGPRRELTNRSSYPGGGTVVGLTQPDQFSSTLDVPFRQGSFEVGVPDFGGFNPNAGMQVGMAILSDIEAFFFIQAAQGDERSNLMFAPKITLFNGQGGMVTSSVVRPFVVSLIPTVGFFSTGFQPVIQNFQDGVTLFVNSVVVSADRRFVRVDLMPFFSNITDVFTFSFVGGTTGAGGGGQQQGNLGQQGGGGGQAFGGGQGAGNFGGGQFGIGGGMGSSQMVMNSAFNQIGGGIGGGQGGNQQGGQQQGNQGAGLTVTVQQPVTEIVTVTTTVSVPDGGTVLLGGVKRLREGRNMAGVPILNKIPYVSRLFKNTGVGRETESLMLMVTPRIIIHEEEEELLGVSIE